MANCVDQVLQNFPEADRQDIQSIYDRMAKVRREGFLAGGVNPDADFRAKVQDMLKRHRRLVEIAKVRALRDEIAYSSAKNFASNPEFKPSMFGKISAYANGLQAWMTGSHQNIPGARLAGDVLMNEAADNQLTHFLSKMGETPGAEAVLKSGANDMEIGHARWYLANGKEIPAGKFSKEVEAIARAWQELGDLQLQTSNDAGAFVNRREGHMYIRSYDPVKIEANPEAFKQWMLDNVDYEKSFVRDFYTADPVEEIDGLIKRIIDRTHGIPQLSDPIGAIKVVNAPSNMAMVMERSRTFEFKTPEAEIEFMQQWSRHPSVAETIVHSIRENARRAILVQKFGSNPGEGFLRLTAGLSAAEKEMLTRHWNVLSGKAAIPADDPVSMWLASARRVTDMGSLGYSTLRSLPDLGSTAGTLQVGERTFLQRQLSVIQDSFANITGEGRRQSMKIAGIGAEHMIGEFFDRVGTTSGGHAWVSKMHQNYFKLIGQKLWTNIAESGMGMTLASGLGESAHLNFSALNEHSAKLFQKYGIGPVEWDVARMGVQEVDGRKFVGASYIRELPDAAVKAVMDAGGLKGSPGAYKRLVAQKIGSYVRDRVDIGMNRAGAFEKASFLNRGWMEGTAEGQAIRFLAHFKSYSYTMATKFSQAFYHEQLKGKSYAEGAATIAPVLVSLTALGYSGQVLWDLAHNRTPSDPTRPEVVVDAMVKGGAGGVMFDFLLGNWDSRHGRNGLAYLAGPELGKIPDLMDLVSQFKQAGLERDPARIRASAITRFVLNVAPGNMPVVRQGLDYLFLNSLAESLNPGYNERMRTRLEKQNQEPIFGD